MVPMTVAVPMELPSTITFTVVPVSVVPVNVGVLSLVRLFCVGAVTTGAVGGWVSTVKVLVLELGPLFPTESEAMARAV